SSALAAPILCDRSTLTAEMLVKIAPTTASCYSAPFPDECHTADQAVAPLTASFQKYSLTTPGEQAAVIALMLFESTSFQYNKNHYPGIPGQGTKNMQSPAFNQKYAEFLYPDQVQVAAVQGPAAVLDLVSGVEDTFGSAAWFLTTQCDASVKAGLATGLDAGWTAYMACIWTSRSAERDALWTAA
ncbi:hypothetical protein P154DRAFT_407506, partial [Amniculicola lignicola CBS 123094]